MRKLVKSDITQQTMKLQQMGAKVKVINSKLCYVTFDISGFILEYAYNVNKKGHYFLERIKPYPLAMQVCNEERKVVVTIRNDVEKFKNALNSHNSTTFIATAREIKETFVEFETVFLNYNVSPEDLEVMHAKIQEVRDKIQEIQKSAEEIKLELEKDSE